jgi:hypothetical protein
MAQVDTNIAMGFRPVQIESPINQMAAIAQLRGAQEASQMNALKMQEYQQQQQERNALSRIMSEPGVEFGSDAFMNRVLAEAPSMYEGIATRAAQRDARKAETDKRRADLAKLNLDELKTAQKDIAGMSSLDEVKADVERRRAAKLLTDEHADFVLAGLPQDSAQFDTWKKRTLTNLLTAEKQLESMQPKPEKLELGGKIVIVDMNPNSATYKQVIREDVKTATPRQEQLLTPEEERQKVRIAAAGRTPAQSDNPAKVAHTSTDDQGNVTFYNAFGQVIRTQTNAGKRSPTLIKQEQAEQNLGRDIARTTKELAEITKDGGLIDQSTGSYAGKAIDVGARIFGKAMPGDIAAGKLAPISDMVLKMVPRFEGPQSDKDTQSYKEAAGQLADPNLPREIRKAAGKEILRLMRERKKEFGVEGMEAAPAAPAAPAPKSDVRSKADAILGNP